MTDTTTPDPQLLVSDVGEFGLIQEIRSLLPSKLPAGVLLGPGDDAAAIRLGRNLAQLVTCDMLVENRHFRLDWIEACQLGRRAIAVNQSDIAAMGGKPLYALVSLGLPSHLELEFFRDLIKGMRDQMAEFDGGIIGGNLSGCNEGLLIDVTLIGSSPLDQMVTRDRARPGDRLFLTGSAGAGAGGLLALDKLGVDACKDYPDLVAAFLAPQPRVEAGQLLAASGFVTAMIDVSDGLSGDAGHICESSGVGVEIDLLKLPILASLEKIARESGLDARSIALHGGDSYELLFTVRPETTEESLDEVRRRCQLPITEIGRITVKGKGWSVVEDGFRRELTARSWDHFK